MVGRRSITSKMMMRRSTTYVPGLGGVNESLAQLNKDSSTTAQEMAAKRTVSELDARPPLFNRVAPPLDHREDKIMTSGDQVTDLFDD